MVVQHNLRAMNSNRMLGITQGTLSKSAEKLSSGYKVNRAADDAAGLSISEKMRKQIRGLTQATANAEDGISAVQTAEGALTEVHDMLQRMNELANKAANGTNSAADRQTIQDEISQLTTEIDRVAETTKFNETYLLKGNGATKTNTLKAHDAGLAGKLVDNGDGTSTFTADKLSTGDKVSIGGTEYNIVESSRTDGYQSIKDGALQAKGTITQDGVTYTIATTAAADASKAAVAVKDADGNSLTLNVKEGSTYTTTLGVSYTLIGKSTEDFDTALTNSVTTGTTFAAGDKVVDENGQEYTYVAAGGFLNDVSHGTAGFYKSDSTNANEDAYSVKAGDTYTIKATGKTGTVANDGITTVKDIQDAIRKVGETAANAGKSFTIYENGKATNGTTYVIGATTKEDGSTYTADDIANLVKEGNIVKASAAMGDFAASKAYYAVADKSNESSDITAKQAYTMMQKELQAASSIGADKGSEAKVNVSTTAGKENVFTIKQASAKVADDLSFALHVGADADMTNKISVGIKTMSSAGLGVKNLNVADDSGKAATYAIDAISDAIETVSKQRSLLGAVQNRLEHTINNLDNVAENTTSAESQIRDTDMATEMVKYSNANILAQAGQSMLAQANQSNQGVLSILG